jgi:hypothetical protein
MITILRPFNKGLLKHILWRVRMVIKGWQCIFVGLEFIPLQSYHELLQPAVCV